MLKSIISGEQSGVEIAAFDAAIKLDIPHKGWAYKKKGAKSAGLHEQYNLMQVETQSFEERLKQNIKNSDGTVILTYGQLAIGSKTVQDLALKYKKPCLYINLTECSINHAISSIRKWISNNEIEAVYFTGSKQVGESNIYAETIRIIEGICCVEREQEMLPGFQEKDDATPSGR